jgi:hypothetical protein
MIDPLNKLCKWRTVLAGWHLGTKTVDEPGVAAMRDLMDKWLVMRVENSALAVLLFRKGVFTAEEYTKQINAEAMVLDNRMELAFPGFRAVSEGVEVYDVELANKTVKDKHFPP